ncbi:MAG: oligosaccharide flippase family protein, partial [Muribaculaceae bacterium]|nr:oligosaccharide flippase family protein [Muribaculaceae bacterium]
MDKIKPQADNGDKGFSGSLTRRIIKAMGVFAGVQSVGMLCSVIRAKLIALWIGPAGVGLNALLTNSLELLGQLTQAGIRVSAVRSIAAAPEGEKQAAIIGSLLRWSIWLGCGGALLTLLLAPLLSMVTFGSMSGSWMFVLLALAVLASAVSAGRSAALQGTGALKRLARLTVTAVVISTLMAIPLFYCLRMDSIVWVVTLFAVVQALVFYSDSHVRRGALDGMSHRECFSLGMPFIRLGLVLTLSNALTMVSSYVITVFLNRYASTEEVGIYQAGFAIINNYMGILVSALTVEYFPRLSANISQRRRCEVLVSHQLVVLMTLLVPGVAVFLMLRNQ